MAVLSDEFRQRLGVLIDPFDRCTREKLKEVLTGESEREEFANSIYDANDNGNPHGFVRVSNHNLTRINSWDIPDDKHQYTFLWVIDSAGLWMILESTPNIKRTEDLPNKPYVCHTNLTGNGQAYIGGEVFFCEDGRIVVNFRSDRYGPPADPDQEDAVIEYFIKCGYKEVHKVTSFSS